MAVARSHTPLTGGNATAVTSFVATAPTGIANGELWVIEIAHVASTGGSGRTVTMSSGGANAWAAVPGASGSLTTYKGEIWWKRWQTGDPTTVTVTFSGAAAYSHVSACYSGTHQTAPFGTPAVNQNATSTTNAVPSLTTTAADSITMIAASMNSPSITWTATPGSSYTVFGAEIATGKRSAIYDRTSSAVGTVLSGLSFTASSTVQSIMIHVEILSPNVSIAKSSGARAISSIGNARATRAAKSGGTVHPSVVGGSRATLVAKSSGAVAISKAGGPGAGQVVSGTTAYRDAILADSPQGYWRLGESGSVAADSSGNGRDATYVDMTGGSVPGLLGSDTDKASDFTGYGWVSCPAAGNPFAFTVGTVEAWVKTTTTGREAVCRLNGYTMGMENGTGFLKAYSWQQNADFNSGVNVCDGLLHHIVFVFDNLVTNGSRFYVDGVPVGSPGTYQAGTNVEALAIGAVGANPSFVGVIDEVAVYNTKLSPARILAHYQAGVAAAAGLHLAPVSTALAGGWQTEIGGTNLHASVDETSPNDSDYIYAVA